MKNNASAFKYALILKTSFQKKDKKFKEIRVNVTHKEASINLYLLSC